MAFGGGVSPNIMRLIQSGAIRPLRDPSDDAPGTPLDERPPVPVLAAPPNTAGDFPQLEISRPPIGDSSQLTPPPGYRPSAMPASRGVDETGQPTVDQSPVSDSIDVAKQGALAPPLSPNAQAISNYKIPTTPQNQTVSGLHESSITDPDIQNMGRAAGAGNAFLRTKQHGGSLVDAGLNAIIGLIDPNYGKQAGVDVRNNRFFMQKAKEEEALRNDPVAQAAIEDAKRAADLPRAIAQNQAYTQARVGGQLQVGAQRIEGNLRGIAARGLNTQDAIAARAKFKADNDINAARDFYSGATDPETGKPYSAAEVEQLAHDDVAEQKNAKLDKLYAQANLDQSRSNNLDEITKNLPEKFKQARQRTDAAIQNAQTNADRLTNQKNSQAQRQAYQDQVTQGKTLQSHINVLETEQKGLLSILNNPFNKDQGSKDAAAARIKAIDGEIATIGTQQDTVSGAPGKGQPATKPGARTSPTGKVVSPDELKSYADANFAGDLEKAKQAYLHHARQRGITVTFQ